MRTLAILIGIVCMVMPGAVTAQTPDWWVRCGGPFQLCGYVERGTAEPRLPFEYEAAKPFRDGLAAVRIDGRWGYIDPQGNLAIPPIYADAMPFRGDLAEVRIDGSSGVIDRTGRVVLAPQFERAIHFAGDVFIVVPKGSADDSWSWGDSDLRSLNGFGEAGLYDLHRGWLTETNLKFTTFDDPARGLLWAGRGEPYREIWGLMRTDGSWQISPQYSYVQRLIGGRAIVRSLMDDSLPTEARFESIKSGAVNADGELVVPFERRWLGAWRGQYAAAGRLGASPGVRPSDGQPEAGLVTLDGELLGGRYFDQVRVAEDGSLPRVRLGNVWYSLSASGELLPDQLDEPRPAGAERSSAARGVNAEWIDGSVSPIARPPDTRSALTCPGGLTLFKSEGRWGMQDGDGNVVVRPESRVINCFSHGSAWAVSWEGREWCPIGPDGEIQTAYRCRQEVYPVFVTHSYPESFHEDPFESSVLWNLARLDYLTGNRLEPPGWVPDGAGEGSYSSGGGLPIPERVDAGGEVLR